MPRTIISGLEIEYELLGKPGAPPIAITPGGRFSKHAPGVPELAKALVDLGCQVLLWDRPNCGGSQLCFDADNESELQGRTLTALIRHLKLGPTTLAGGSGGARVTLIAGSRDPEVVSNVVVWWVSGGTLGLMQLGAVYCVVQAGAAARGGMAEVAKLPDWQEQIKLNPRNRDILMAQDPKKYINTMERWAEVYIPSKESPVPGMSPQNFADLKMPVLIFRSSTSDIYHPRKTTDWVHKLIPHSKMIDPPWSDEEFARRTADVATLFGCWPQLAPAITEFIKK